MDPDDALRAADLDRAEVRRRIGGRPGDDNDVVRQRLAALLEPWAPAENPASDAEPDDARLCGAVIVRLGGAATATVIAEWMDWALERVHAALAEVDRRLDRCGLQLIADGGGGLVVRERARLRARPRRPPLELAERLGDEQHRHALAHLVRGDLCATGEAGAQLLLDVGAAIPAGYPGVYPADLIAPAFVGSRRRSPPLPRVVLADENGQRRYRFREP